MADPKKGTGKKPKGSGRRLYTDENKKMVPIDTSGPDATIDIEEQKDEAVIEQPQENTEQEQGKVEEKRQDENLEDYSKGVQARIAKLTRKMREAERREQAAVEYARAVENKRQALEKRFEKMSLLP